MVALMIAAGSIYLTTYDPGQAFGSVSSYGALAVAILGAEMAGTIGGLLTPWRTSSS